MAELDVLVIGGGLVGSAIAYGLRRRGQRVTVLDEGDTAIRAARANGGLVWVQGKGDGMPAYARWTRRSADLWGGFAADLKEVAGIDVQHRQPGGLVFCLGDSENEARARTIRRLHNQTDVHEIEMIDRTQVEALLPGLRLGSEVTGASFCPHDGHVNPLLLLRGLHAALKRLGVAYRPDAPARTVSWERGVFVVQTPAGRIEAGKLVLAAGHGIPVLARSLGLAAPIVVERGQIMITERVAPFMPLPALEFRQTGEGTVQIGATHERIGYDLSTTPRGAARFVDRAVRVLPSLASVQVARVWAGLRVLTPDGCPAYMQSETRPGSFVAICHSGVTLAAAHAEDLAAAIVAGALPDSFTPFHPRRFDVPQAA